MASKKPPPLLEGETVTAGEPYPIEPAPTGLPLPSDGKKSHPPYTPLSSELDFCSLTFDAAACLMAEHVNLPYPTIRPLNNIAEYHYRILARKEREENLRRTRAKERDQGVCVCMCVYEYIYL